MCHRRTAGTRLKGHFAHEDLPTFDNALSPEESESFLTFPTARHIAPPLVLRFLLVIDRPTHEAVQRIVESVLFEPLEFAAIDKEANEFTLQRVPARDRHELGTPYGVAMAEAQHTPEAILGPLLDICRSAADKCIGDYRSSFVDLLLFCLRLTFRFQGMCRHFGKHDLAAMHDLDHFLSTVAVPLLSIWVDEAFTHGNISRQLQLHAHLAMLQAPGASFRPYGCGMKEEKDDDTKGPSAAETGTMRSFLCSSSYVVCWHSKSENEEEDEDDKGGETKTPEQKRMEQVMAMMGVGPGMMMGMMGTGGRKGGVSRLVVTSHRTPTHAVFALIEHSRESVIDWVQKPAPLHWTACLKLCFVLATTKSRWVRTAPPKIRLDLPI